MQRERLDDLLQRISEGDDAAREELLAHIMAQPAGVRVLALEALREGGDDTYNQLLLTLVDDPELTIREPSRNQPLPPESDLSALHPIAQMAGAEWQAHTQSPRSPSPDLLAQLRGSDRTARISAARALGDYRDPQSIAALVETLSGSDLRVAAAAIEALHQIGRPALSALLPLLEHRDSQTRWHATKAIGPVADATAAPALIARLDDSHSGTRWLAAEALASMGQPAVIPLLRALLGRHSSAWLRQGAHHVLSKLQGVDDAAKARYRRLAQDIRRESDAILPDVVRRELRQLGEDA